MEASLLGKAQTIYQKLTEAWNDRNAQGMAELFTDDGESIGFDGSHSIGRSEIFDHLQPIFENHPTAPFVTKVKDVQELDSNVVLVRAIAGMVPPGQHRINPELNTHHTVIVVQEQGKWLIKLFQNTPAQFHGRPELVEEMTKELQ